MLNRIFLHLSLIVLFAFTQIGVTAHQISHLNHHQEEHHQQDQNSHEEECGQCITYNHIADADIAHEFWLEATPIEHHFSNGVNAVGHAQQAYFYCARGPPHSLKV